MKTHHRITGTILAIALAATTAAPAATPPQLKLPPKAPVAVKVPAAPKVPAVKTPAAPKIVSAPKVPVTVKTPVAPKVPAVKAPAVPTIVSVPQAPKAPVVVRGVSAPVTPKAPVTPRLPVTPKVVTLPPTVKTPAAPVKVPDLSRAPGGREVKVPAVAIKRPTVIVPPTEAPKVRAMGGGKPQGSSNTTLAANSGKRAAIAEAVKTSATLTRGSAASGIRSAVESARRDNPGNRLAETFLPDLPKTPKGRDPVSGTPRDSAKPGTGGRTVTKELFDTLTGKGGGAGKGLFSDVLPQRETPVLKDRNQAPGFDQGFGSRPDVSGFDPGSLNPMNGIVNNSGIGGPLGEAANRTGNGVPSGGVAGMGRSLISSNPIAGEVTVLGTVGGAAAAVNAGATLGGTAVSGIGAVGAAGASAAVSGVVGAAAAGLGVGTALNAANDAIVGGVASLLGSDIKDQVDLLIAAGDALGSLIDSASDALSGGSKPNEVIDIGEIVITGTPPADDSKNNEVIDIGEIVITGNAPSAGQPDPENEGTVRVNIYDLSPGLAQHIGQSRLGKKGSQGGSGDVKPADDSGTGAGRVIGAEISPTFATDLKNNLVGNPGQRGVRESGGSATPPARSNGSGTITPTDDQNTATSGGRQEDPGDFFGNGVRPDQSRLNGGNSGSGSSSSGDNQDDAKSK